MSTQRAILLKEAKTPLVHSEAHPVPEPQAGQVQVKVTVAGLNGHDQKVRDLGIFLGRVGLPAVLANDVVGKVVKVGENVTSFKEGDRVVSQAAFDRGTPQNGLQEYAVFHEQFTARIPDSISDDDAATLPTNIIATLVALFHDLPIPAPWTQEAQSFDYQNATLLIVGGGSVAGRYAVQLAKIAGIGKIVVVGGQEEELKSYGATHVLNRHGGQDVVLERIRSVIGDDLIYAYDVVNFPEGQLMALNALSSHKKGYLARLLPMPVDESRVHGKRAGFELKNVLGISSDHPELCREFWKRLPGYLEQGLIVPFKGEYQITEGLSAETANKLLDSFKDGQALKHAHIHL
ncbi:hypothetical protein H2198_003084 [Neophaeococcomyces mojaviensis]|uniref:Uncharacterized protein n=1 Tax=Neophaeococcomyces mojaviensis TaxID=3383035 RepID=A0ACC3ACS9_9EURO|nr:hypothetical protein H2198_003084 [Knufia sp. JES_112]